MTPIEDAGESLDAHWAVAVFDAADRRELLAFAEDARRRILTGAWIADSPVPDQLLALSSAYELATRERLDLFGAGHPNTSASLAQRAERSRRLELGARRATDLALAIPLDDTDAHGVLYHTLLLAALATVAGRDSELHEWLVLHRAKLFESGVDDDWPIRYLRSIVELWAAVLDGSGPSGLEHAMELVATIREQRPDHERESLENAEEANEMSLRFFFFALHHLTDAATELLLFRLHGAPEDIRQRIFVALSLAGEATAGDARIHAALDWLYEASARIIARRTPQLDLLPHPAPAPRAGSVH
jgi:hypothetical protein